MCLFRTYVNNRCWLQKFVQPFKLSNAQRLFINSGKFTNEFNLVFSRYNPLSFSVAAATAAISMLSGVIFFSPFAEFLFICPRVFYFYFWFCSFICHCMRFVIHYVIQRVLMSKIADLTVCCWIIEWVKKLLKIEKFSYYLFQHVHS